MTKTKSEEKAHTVLCPVGRFFADLEKASGKDSAFFEHMKKSRVEFLKGIRSLVDERIEAIEKKGASGDKRKATRVQVE
ncbi:MAG: hypothetical protein K9L83_07980 [Deltaproteobacteria bacterium]|nr:hypothetical protein [Deltaproteobacteria bacterium]